MGDDQEPDWNLLPRFPLAFFGFTKGATREQIKQAYSLLIRKYKPDKFPSEFKRIRAAYEQLDLLLRTGEAEASSTPEIVLPIAKAPNPQDSARNELSPRAGAFQRRQESNPNDWYRELSEKLQKTKYDYYVLATLSEVVDPGSKGFADWIAEGLKTTPNAKEFVGLLQSYFDRITIAPEEVSNVLLRLVQVLPGTTFFQITQSLWQRYSLMVPWETFRTVLETCEEHVGFGDLAHRRKFSVQLMRRVLWRAPLEWLLKRRKWIDENIHGISPDMEFYHDINCRLLLLREKYLWQLQRGPYGHRILDAIVSFCEEDGGATAKVCACQVEIAQHPRKFLSEFEFNPEDQIGWTYAWNYISWTATTKLTIREHEADPDQQVRSIACLRNRIDHRSPKTILVVVGIMNLIGFGLFSVLCIVSLLTIVIGFFALVMKLVGDKSEKMGIIAAISPVVLMVGGAALALFAWEKLKYYWNTKFIVPYVQRRFAYEYRNKWRIWVAHSMQVLTSPYQSYLGLVKHLCSNGNNLRNPSARLAEYLENDSGLALYSAAIPFAR